jgi:heterodisulfide reductase subunit C1
MSSASTTSSPKIYGTVRNASRVCVVHARITLADLVTILREVSLKNGLQESKDALQGYSRVIYKVMLKGNQVSPDMLQPDFFPDWGPWVQNFTQNMHVWRKAIPMDSIRGLTDVAWRTDRKTLLELYTIWFESGNMDIIKELDESLYDLLTEVMQEELEEG